MLDAQLGRAGRSRAGTAGRAIGASPRIGSPRTRPGRGAGGSAPSPARAGARRPAAAARRCDRNRVSPPRPGARRGDGRTTPEARRGVSQSSQTSSRAACARPGSSGALDDRPVFLAAAVARTARRAARGLRRLGPDDDPGDGPVEPMDRPEVGRRRVVGVQVTAHGLLPGSARPAVPVPWVNSPAGLTTARQCVLEQDDERLGHGPTPPTRPDPPDATPAIRGSCRPGEPGGSPGPSPDPGRGPVDPGGHRLWQRIRRARCVRPRSSCRMPDVPGRP